MSRVLHCIASLAVGGVETCVLDMLKHCTDKKPRHEHLLCAFRGGKLEQTHLSELTQRGVEAHVLARPSRYSLSFCRQLRETIQKTKPDIVQAYNPTAALWVRLVMPKRNRPKIVVHCGGVGGLQRLPRWIEWALAARADAFVFNSHSTQAVWESFLKLRCPRRVVYNGVTFRDDPGTPRAADIPDSPFTLLTVCRIVPVKSLHVQINAVKILHDRGQRDVRLVIVGDGPEKERLEKQVRKLGLESAVTFAGYQKNPRTFHRQAHVYLGTSYNETFSMTLAEAMFDRMVCIAAAAGGPSEIIEHERSGFLVPCTQPLPPEHRGRLPVGQALPEKSFDYTTGTLRGLLAIDPDALADRIADVRARFDQLSSLRDEARSRIVENFSVERYCNGLEDFYDDLTSLTGTG